MEKKTLILKTEIKSFLNENYSFNILLKHIILEKETSSNNSFFSSNENLKNLIINLINDDKFIEYLKNNKNLNINDEIYETFFNILNYLYINNNYKIIYSLSSKLNEPLKNYSLIYFFALTKKFDFYISEINNLLLKNYLNDWIKLFHIFFIQLNNLKIKLSPKFILLKDKNINLIHEITKSYSNFLISNFKLGTLNYYSNEFESFKLIKNENNLNKLLDISCIINKEDIKNELLKNKDLNLILIESLKSIIIKENLNKIEKNINYLQNIDKKLEENNSFEDIYLFPNIKYFLFKCRLLKSQSLLQNKYEINNLKKIILNFIYNDPGYEPFYSILLYFYSIINEKDNFFTLFEKYKNIFDINLIQNESIINLCKSFFILKDYDNCRNILKFYKGKLPDTLIKINRIIQN